MVLDQGYGQPVVGYAQPVAGSTIQYNYAPAGGSAYVTK